MKDTNGGLFGEIDRDLGPFLEALDAGADAPRTPTDIITPEARQLVVDASLAYRRAVRDALSSGRKPTPAQLMQEVTREMPQVKFQGDGKIGFFVVPGVNKIDPDDVKRNLVVAGIDFDEAEAAALARLGHYHVGALTMDGNRRERYLPGEYADTWDTERDGRPDVGLYWADLDHRHHAHRPHDGIRVGQHGSYDDYTAVTRHDGGAVRGVNPPSFYVGAYWGGIDMKSQVYPDIRRLGERMHVQPVPDL